MYRAYKDKVLFYLVYVKEAHPSDGRQTKSNIRANVVYTSPKTLRERAGIATDCVKSLKLEIPCLLDDMDNTVQKMYKGFPARACIVNPDGTIAFISKPGPRGIRPEEIRKALQALLDQSE